MYTSKAKGKRNVITQRAQYSGHIQHNAARKMGYKGKPTNENQVGVCAGTVSLATLTHYTVVIMKSFTDILSTYWF